MAATESARDLIDRIFACDEQPSEERLTELRKSLAAKVARLIRRARYSRAAAIAGLFLLLAGSVPISLGSPDNPRLGWLTLSAQIAEAIGVMLIIGGCVGLVLSRGFAYIWARDDLHDAAIMELSAQVQRLAQQIDTLKKNS
jgi:hypothetical protein